MAAVVHSRLGRVGSGVAWIGLAGLGTHLINLARVMVVARLLSPEDFGVFGMAMTVLLGLSAFGQFGLKEAFIAHDQPSEAERQRWLSAVWTGNLLIQGLIALLLVLAAWPAAYFYGRPELVPMLVVLAAAPVLKALSNPALMGLEKRIAFGRVALFELSVAATSLLTAVLLAWLTGSVWAMIVGHVAGTAGGAVVSYVLFPQWPRPRWDSRTLYRALGFGKYMMVVAVLGAVNGQFDNLVIGAHLGAAALGIYVIAFRVSDIPRLLIENMTARSLFPYYSEVLGEGRAKLGRAWQMASGYVIWLTLAAYVPIALCADYFVTLLFGWKWVDAAPILVVLTILGGLRVFARTTNSLFLAIRKPNVEAMLKVVEVGLFIPAVFIGLALEGSAIGIAWAAVACCAVIILLRMLYILPHMEVSPVGFGIRLLRPGLGAVLMAAAGFAALASAWHPLLVTILIWLVWTVALLTLEPELRHWLWVRRLAWSEALA